MRARDSVKREREKERERERDREIETERVRQEARERVCENDRWSDRLANAGIGRQINGERE